MYEDGVNGDGGKKLIFFIKINDVWGLVRFEWWGKVIVLGRVLVRNDGCVIMLMVYIGVGR